MLHARTIQPKDIYGLVLFDAVKSICRQAHAPCPATAKVPYGLYQGCGFPSSIEYLVEAVL